VLHEQLTCSWTQR